MDKSPEEYLDRYEGVKSEILNTTRFNSLGKWSITRNDNMVVEEIFQ